MSDRDLAERVAHLEAENARLRRLLDQQGMTSTLRHQVRNALGLMRAVLRRSAESKTTVEDFAAHLEGRFDALLRVQTILLSSPDDRADLFGLVTSMLMTQDAQAGDRISLNGPELRVDGRCAELLGLVIHELTTNALKFGALAKAAGRIDVSWTVASAPPELALTWIETKQDRADDRPGSRGFGMEAIEGMLPYQLKGDVRLDFRPEGLHCTIALPMTG